MRILRPLIFPIAACALFSCANKQQETVEKKEDANKPRIVGRIASIPAGRNFVLIQSYGNWNVETGSVLTTVGPGGRAANLRATGEKLGQYAAADIQSGTLDIGDGVYTIAAPPATAGEEEKPTPPGEGVEEPGDTAPTVPST